MLTIVNIVGIHHSHSCQKVEMDKIAERRKRIAFAILFVAFLGAVIATLLWALDML
jgi:hypothetical protein